MRVVGIDPSLNATGIAVIDKLYDNDDTVYHPMTTTVVPPAKLKGEGNLQYNCRRLRYIRQTVEEIIDVPDFLCYEGPSYASKSQAFHQLAGGWWFIIEAIEEIKVPIAIMSPHTVKQYATGKGGGKKDQILLAVERRYRDFIQVNNDNEADAFVLAAMGMRHCGFPIEESLPQTHLAAMNNEKNIWPERKIYVPKGEK